MERYFDVHLYLANWGTRRIMVRLPRAVLAPETAAMFCAGESARSWATRTHVVVDLRSEDEDGDEEWWDEQERLAAIAPARAELAGGDRRLLYLAWLLCVQNREVDDGEPEPPVPAGLAELSGPLRSLSDFLRLDPDLLDVAAEASGPLAGKASSAAALRRWVRELPEADKTRSCCGCCAVMPGRCVRNCCAGFMAWRSHHLPGAAGPWVICAQWPRVAGLSGSSRSGSVRPLSAAAVRRPLPLPGRSV